MAMRMIAPTTAAMIDPISPPAAMPNRPNNQPPISDNADHYVADKAKTAPLIITPASHPATAPISKKMMIPVSIMRVGLLHGFLSRSTRDGDVQP